MALTNSLSHVNLSTINTTFLSPLNPTSLPSKQTKRTQPRCAALSPNSQTQITQSRRVISISLALLHSLSSLPPHAIAAGGMFDNYIRRKQLEPLETYVPAVILTQLQIKDIDKSLEVDQHEYAAYRSILRSGPSASFRSNVRAVAQYASDGGKGKTAFDDVNRCLRALDEFDSLLLRATRKNPDASAKVMREKISVAVNALDSLLQSIPSEILDKSRAIAEAYRTPEPESYVAPEELEKEFKDLQSVL